MHALVDAGCAMCIWRLVTSLSFDTTYYATLIIAYNLIAFALQAPLGLFVDTTGCATLSVALGAIVTGIGIMLFPYMPIAGICIAGLGNALFHVGGGAHAICATPGKAAGPGLFVAPGALGLFVGALMGKSNFLPTIFLALIILFGAGAVYFICPRIHKSKAVIGQMMPVGLILSIAGMLFFSVMVRSIAGLSIGAMWNKGIVVGIILVSATVGGKAFGGIVADKAGWLVTGTICLLSSSLLIGTAAGNVAVIAIGVLLLHATMGITVATMVRALGSYPATAFGLCSFALVIGGMPIFFTVRSLFINSMTISVLIFLSGLALFFALRKVQAFDRKTSGIIEDSLRNIPFESISVIKHGGENEVADS